MPRACPGARPTWSDAAWLWPDGPVRAAPRPRLCPREPIRHLRDLTRYRATLVTERSREAGAAGAGNSKTPGSKLSAVATDILGVSGRAMLAARIDGERNGRTLAELAKPGCGPRSPAGARR